MSLTAADITSRYYALTRMTGAWDHFQGTARALVEVQGRHAADFHDNVCAALHHLGWTVTREYHVALPNDRGGRIDVLARRRGWVLALELDNRTPRGKSILKLECLTGENLLTAVLLRNP